MKILTRKEYHSKKWKKIYGLEDCPFCDNSKVKKIWEWKYWYIVRNFAPYSGDEKHLMVIPHKHKKYSIELSKEEFWELVEIHKFMKDFYQDENYFSVIRETMWNRSVEHLHIHFIPWRLQWKYLRKMLENQWFPIKEDLKI